MRRPASITHASNLKIGDYTCIQEIKLIFEGTKNAESLCVATSDASSNILALTITELLRDARILLEMDIVFVSEFIEGQRVIRWIDKSSDADDTIQEGQSNPLEETYCQRVVDGRLPLAIPDAKLLPEVDNLDVTKSLKIRAYLAAPIVLSDGRTFGTLCCISHQPRTALGNRQVDALRVIAQRVAVELQKNLNTAK